MAPRPARPIRGTMLAALIAAAIAVSVAPGVRAQESPAPSGAPPSPVAEPSGPPTPSAELVSSPSPASSAEPAPPAPAPRVGDAGAWEYRTVFADWDTQIAEWVATFSDGTRTVGLVNILNAEGAAGWELVTIVPEFSVDVIYQNLNSHEVRRIRAYFKRPAP